MNYNKELEKALEKLERSLEKVNGIDEIGLKIQEYALETTRILLEELDEVIFRSETRRKEYESKGKEERTIVTLQGEIRYKRRRYIEKERGRHVYIRYFIRDKKKREIQYRSNQKIDRECPRDEII